MCCYVSLYMCEIIIPPSVLGQRNIFHKVTIPVDSGQESGRKSQKLSTVWPSFHSLPDLWCYIFQHTLSVIYWLRELESPYRCIYHYYNDFLVMVNEQTDPAAVTTIFSKLSSPSSNESHLRK